MSGNDARLEQLARRLGIESIPSSWSPNWEAFSSWASVRGECWELPSNAVDVFDLPAESLDDLSAMYKAIRENDALSALADFWHYMIYHLPEGMERNTNVWGIPDDLIGHSTKVFSLAVMVSGADHAVESFAQTGVSDEVIGLTLGYIGRYARDIKAKRGVWGLESVGWLSNYVRAQIFRLGRLTFKSGSYYMQFRVFRSRRTGEVIALCDGPAKYRTDGLSDGTNGIHDPDAWTPTLEIGEDRAVGYPAANGAVSREAVALNTGEWEQVLAPGDKTVEVHIAGGSRLLPQECIDSYRQAVEFFPRHYAPITYRGFTCWSWLLDPSLPRILGPESNIVQFQEPFHIMPVASNEAQAYDLVFGSSTADPTKYPCTTKLQKAIADFVSAGNRMRSAAGFILWDEVGR